MDLLSLEVEETSEACPRCGGERFTSSLAAIEVLPTNERSTAGQWRCLDCGYGADFSDDSDRDSKA